MKKWNRFALMLVTAVVLVVFSAGASGAGRSSAVAPSSGAAGPAHPASTMHRIKSIDAKRSHFIAKPPFHSIDGSRERSMRG